MKSIRIYGAAWLVAVLALAAGLRSAYYIRIDNDGMRYALVADQILKGNGLKLIAYGVVPLGMGPPPDSSGLWPDIWQMPLLPVSYALLGGVRPGRVWPAQAVNILAHLVASLCAFRVARRCAGNVAGMGAGALVAISYPLLALVGQAWTEPLFIAFLMMTVCMLQASRFARPQWRYFASGGLAAGAACKTRNSGLALIPLFLCAACIVWYRKGARPAARLMCLGALPPVIAIGVWMARNIWLYSSLIGFALATPDRGWTEALRGMLALLVEQSGFDEPGWRAALTFLLLAVPACALLLSPGIWREVVRMVRRGLDLPLVAAAWYLGALVIALTFKFPMFEVRFAAPLIPLFAIVAMVIIARGWNAVRERGAPRIAAIGLAISLAVIAGGEASRSYLLLPHTLSSGVYGSESECVRWVLAHNSPKRAVATNAPYAVAFFTGMTTAMLPYCHPWLSFERLPADLDRRIPEWMRRIGAEYLLLLRVVDGLPQEEWGSVWGSLQDGLPENVWGGYIARLSRPSTAPRDQSGVSGERVHGTLKSPQASGPERLIRVYECSLGVVYRLAEGG